MHRLTPWLTYPNPARRPKQHVQCYPKRTGSTYVHCAPRAQGLHLLYITHTRLTYPTPPKKTQIACPVEDRLEATQPTLAQQMHPAHPGHRACTGLHTAHLRRPKKWHVQCYPKRTRIEATQPTLAQQFLASFRTNLIIGIHTSLALQTLQRMSHGRHNH